MANDPKVESALINFTETIFTFVNAHPEGQTIAQIATGVSLSDDVVWLMLISLERRGLIDITRATKMSWKVSPRSGS